MRLNSKGCGSLNITFCVVLLILLIENVQINFGTAPTGNMQCEASPQCIEEDICGWSGVTITSRVARTFRVKIGLSGGLRGYEYITGKFDIHNQHVIYHLVLFEMSLFYNMPIS